MQNPYRIRAYRAPAPATISVISWVMAAWRARLYLSSKSLTSSCALSDAVSMAVRLAACSEAKDSTTAPWRIPAKYSGMMELKTSSGEGS